MTVITVKHVMDEKFEERKVDDVFMEAIELGSDVEGFDQALFEFLTKHPDHLEHITTEYKLEVIKAWDFTIQ